MLRRDSTARASLLSLPSLAQSSMSRDSTVKASSLSPFPSLSQSLKLILVALKNARLSFLTVLILIINNKE